MSMQNVKWRLRVTLRLHVPLRPPVSVCTFHAGSKRNSSGSCMSSRNASILRSLSTESGGTPFVMLGVQLFQTLWAKVRIFT